MTIPQVGVVIAIDKNPAYVGLLEISPLYPALFDVIISAIINSWTGSNSLKPLPRFTPGTNHFEPG